MGNSDSRPSFNYEAQLFADNTKSQSVEVDDPAGQPANATRPRRLAGLEKGLVSVPYAQGRSPREHSQQGRAERRDERAAKAPRGKGGRERGSLGAVQRVRQTER